MALKRNIMVCVTNNKTCDKLIARGIELDSEGIHVVHCVEVGRNFLGTPFEGDAIEYLFTAAQLAGADLALLRAPNVDDALVEYAKKNKIGMIIMGASDSSKKGGEGIAMRLQRRLPDVEFDIVV